MTDAKSYLAARNLRDIFAGLGWGPWQITALACEMPDRVIIQYKSEELGETRQVMADPVRLAAWMRPRATRTSWLLEELSRLLDRKPVRPAPLQQGALFSSEQLPPEKRYSMTPNEP